MSKLIFEIGGKGRRAFRFPKCDVPEVSLGSILGEDNLRAAAPALPECGEVDVVRHELVKRIIRAYDSYDNKNRVRTTTSKGNKVSDR